MTPTPFTTPALSARRRTFVPLRFLVAAFCWLTAAYAFVASSAFAYQQFLRPRVFPSIGVFSDWHAAIFWVWFALALVVLLPEFQKGGRARVAAAVFAGLWGLVGLWLVVNPLLPRLADGRRSVVVGIVALVPAVWLAIVDHLRAVDLLRRQAPASPEALDSAEARLLVAGLGSAVVVTMIYAMLTPLVMGDSFEPDLLTTGLAVGLTVSLVEHLLLFCAAFLGIALVERTVARLPGFAKRYAVAALLYVTVLAIALQRVLAEGLGLAGPWSAAAAAASSASIVATWAGLRLRRLDGQDVRLVSTWDVLFGPPRGESLRARHLAPFLVLTIAAYAFAMAFRRTDWDFLLLKSGVVIVWLATFGKVYRVIPDRRLSVPAVALLCLVPLVAHRAAVRVQARTPGGTRATTGVRHVLDRYMVYNPSFRFADGLLSADATDRPTFDRFLRANTGFTDVAIPPIGIDFVQDLQRSRAEPKPLIFLFIIDSLRPDYLAPYNAAVRFTPRLAEFAGDSLVFKNAFTRYGGTGLSIPAIWAGSAIVHKQYVQPFHAMNALEKLLDANSYRRFISLDHIMSQLLEPAGKDKIVELDRGVPEMDYKFCTTLGQIEDKLGARDVERQPVFATTRPLDLHIAKLRARGQAADALYSGFYGPYASTVREIDACFGDFVDFLKRRDLYDRSLIVLTSDHGELLGEEGVWGHIYHMFPPVIQVPLIIHLPSAVARTMVADVEAVSFSTDITPTIYAALGYQPRHDNPLMGAPLIAPAGADREARRRESYVLAASYGAVYAVLRQNGSRLYIVNGIKGGDDAFERGPGGWTRVEVSDGLRTMNQRMIREYIDQIARDYQLGSRP